MPSQDIRNLIKSKRILTDYNDEVEGRIQTNSFEPTVKDYGYWVDDDVATLLKSNSNQPIEKTLEKIPRSKKIKIDITNGHTLLVGHTYIFPLNEKIKLEEDEYAKVSPKSSIGRTFLDTRCFAEKNPCSDIIHPRFSGNEHVQLWLLVYPQKFNVIIRPNIAFNQIRFFKGVGAKLTREEIEKEFEKSPFLLSENGDKYDSFITEDSVITHVCLESRNKRRKLSRFVIEPGDFLLLFTDEVFNLPPHLNAEMRAYSLTNIRGPLHFAGFFDNGFKGDGVIELASEEKGTFILGHKSPVAEFDFYRTREVPDKIYGDAKSGSNYYSQKGPKVPKYFRQIETSDIIAFRAKKTPKAIDLSKKHFYEVDEFFDII